MRHDVAASDANTQSVSRVIDPTNYQTQQPANETLTCQTRVSKWTSTVARHTASGR